MFQAIRTSPAGLATLVFVVICHCKSVSSAKGRMDWLSFKGGFSKTFQSEMAYAQVTIKVRIAFSGQ